MTSENFFPSKEKKRHKNPRELSVPDPQVRPPVLAQHPEVGCPFVPPVRGVAVPLHLPSPAAAAAPRVHGPGGGGPARRVLPGAPRHRRGGALSRPVSVARRAAGSIFSWLPGRFAQAPWGGSASRLRIGLCKAPLPQPIPSGYANFPHSRAFRRGSSARPARELGRGQDGCRGSLLACLRHLRNENSSFRVENRRIAFLPPKLKIMKNPFWASIKRNHGRAASFACQRPACTSPR